jgi:RDD family
MRVRTPWGRAGRVRYADPSDRYFARFGSPLRRIGAATVDWTICYVLFVLVSIPLGMLQMIGTVSWEAGDLGGVPGHVLFVIAQLLIAVAVLSYWVLLLPTSQTFGMRLADIRLVSMRTGNGLSYVGAALRGVVATATAAAVYAVYLNTTAFDKGDRLDDTSQLLLNGSYVVAGIGFASALAMLLTPTHRSLYDRAFGTAAVDELESTSPHFGPWGPLDAFDTSHRRGSLAG